MKWLMHIKALRTIPDASKYSKISATLLLYIIYFINFMFPAFFYSGLYLKLVFPICGITLTLKESVYLTWMHERMSNWMNLGDHSMVEREETLEPGRARHVWVATWPWLNDNL